MKSKKHFLEPYVFCPSDGLKPKDIQYAIIYDKEKTLILIFKKVESDNIWLTFWLKND